MRGGRQTLDRPGLASLFSCGLAKGAEFDALHECIYALPRSIMPCLEGEGSMVTWDMGRGLPFREIVLKHSVLLQVLETKSGLEKYLSVRVSSVCGEAAALTFLTVTDIQTSCIRMPLPNISTLDQVSTTSA